MRVVGSGGSTKQVNAMAYWYWFLRRSKHASVVIIYNYLILKVEVQTYVNTESDRTLFLFSCIKSQAKITSLLLDPKLLVTVGILSHHLTILLIKKLTQICKTSS